MKDNRTAHYRALAAVLLAAGVAAGSDSEAQAAPAPAAIPSIAGTWAMEGTGPAGFVAAGGRGATVVIHQRGHTLTVSIQSGGKRYSATGASYWPQPRITFKWQMRSVGAVHFDGALQKGHARVLGQWSDARGDDGGALLVRVHS